MRSGRIKRWLRMAGAEQLAEFQMQVRDGLQELRDWSHELTDRISNLERHSEYAEAYMSSLEQRISQLDARGSDLERSSHELATRLSSLEERLSHQETDRSLYVALAELRRTHLAIAAAPATDPPPGKPMHQSLTPWELRAFSQNGEDGILGEILRRIGASTRFFVEFGAETGSEGNCVFLADVAGWRGLFIEAEESAYAELARKFAPLGRVRTLRGTVTPDNVQELFQRGRVPHELDVLSIDVDGSDYWVWEALRDYRPRVVVIEYNALLPPERRLVQPRDLGAWDGTDYYGASLGAVKELGRSKGYRLVHTELAGVNAFFVREELAADRFPTEDEVPVRGMPNYFLSSYRHPRDPHNRGYLDLETGEMVPVVAPQD